MTAIASYSDLLLGDKMGLADPMQRRYLQRIQQGVERLEAVLNELGDEATVSGRRTTPVPIPPIGEVINQAVDAAQNVFSLDGVSIERDIGDELPPVQVDVDYIGRILADLLAASGARCGVGDSVVVSTEVRAGEAGPGHLVVLIHGGGAGRREAPSLEEDTNIRSAELLAEDAGARIWTELQDDGSSLIRLLLPVVAEPRSKHEMK